MIRKVMVLATACLIPSLAGAASNVLMPGCRAGSPGRPTAESNSGCRRRRSLGKYFGKYLGASTAAPPITRPGISATSNKATPAATTPMVAATVTKSGVGLALAAAEAIAGSAVSDPRSTPGLYFDTAYSISAVRCDKGWQEN